MALDIDGDFLVHANRQVVCAIGMGDGPLALLQVAGLIVQGLVQLAHGGGGKIDGFHVRAP